jgi:hypothetical protein
MLTIAGERVYSCRRRATERGSVSTVETVRRLLSSVTADALCDACLAAACAINVIQIRAAIDNLFKSDRAFHRGSLCASCRRTVPTIFYRVDADRRNRRGAAAQ